MDIVPFWRKPKMITGRDSLKKLPDMLRHKGIKNVMLVTDPGIASLGLHEQLLEWIREEALPWTVPREWEPGWQDLTKKSPP